MGKYISIVEGDGEKSICRMLKQEGYLFGRIIKKPIQEIKNISRTLNMIDSSNIVIVIMDTDTLLGNQILIDRMIKNLLFLINTAKEVMVITENLNLEDELIKGIPTINNSRQLCTFFSEVTLSDYKARLAQMSEGRLKSKLSVLDLNKFWSDMTLSKYTDNELIKEINVTIGDIPKNW